MSYFISWINTYFFKHMIFIYVSAYHQVMASGQETNNLINQIPDRYSMLKDNKKDS